MNCADMPAGQPIASERAIRLITAAGSKCQTRAEMKEPASGLLLSAGGSVWKRWMTIGWKEGMSHE